MKMQEDFIRYLQQHPEEATPTVVSALIEEIERLRKLKGAARIQRTHCVQGHALTEGNLYYSKTGARRCRLCTRKYQSEYQKRHPEKYAHRLEVTASHE